MPLAGLVARIAYRLSRHRLLGLPLDVALALGAAGVVLFDGACLILRRSGPLSPVAAAALVLWVAASLALRLRAFALFRPEKVPVPAGAALEPFRTVPVRATGVFEVSGQSAYYVEAPGAITATELGERIVMVKLRPLSLLGLVPSREEEWGWWYLFFRPEELLSPVAGRLCFGWRPRPALRLQRRGRGRPLAYLSFDHPAARDLVAADLQEGCGGGLSAPPSDPGTDER